MRSTYEQEAMLTKNQQMGVIVMFANVRKNIYREQRLAGKRTSLMSKRIRTETNITFQWTCRRL